jgi:hypothetical protein
MSVFPDPCLEKIFPPHEGADGQKTFHARRPWNRHGVISQDLVNIEIKLNPHGDGHDKKDQLNPVPEAAKQCLFYENQLLHFYFLFCPHVEYSFQGQEIHIRYQPRFRMNIHTPINYIKN